MRILYFDDYKLGVVKDGNIVDVSSAVENHGILPPNTLMENVIANFDSLRPKFEEIMAKSDGVPWDSVRLRAPLPRPHYMLCAFSNYLDRENSDRKELPAIDFFHKGSGVIGDGDTVTLEDLGEGATAYQPEPEFAYVIGKNARYVKEEDALDYIFGYMNFVDVSARGPGVQGRRTTFMHKGMETWAPMGPAIVTKDEYPDPQNIQVKLWRNGELRQDYNTSDMAHGVAKQIAWLTQYVQLEPGDIVSCGTHHRGLSNINNGDKFEMEVADFGRLHCDVVSYGPDKLVAWAPPGTKKA